MAYKKLTKKEKNKRKKDKHKLSKSYLKKQQRIALRKADTLWSKKVREVGECIICRSKENLHAHHIIPREFKETRHLLINGVCLCAKHHKFGKVKGGVFSAHGNSFWFLLRYRQIYPDKYFSLIKIMSDLELNNFSKI